MTCTHRTLRAWTLGSEDPYLWSCFDCGQPFAPVGEHPHAALSRALAFGGKAAQTDDGGRTWRPIEVDGEGDTPD